MRVKEEHAVPHLEEVAGNVTDCTSKKKKTLSFNHLHENV